MMTSIRYNKTERDRRRLSWERSSMADRRRRNWGRSLKEPGETVLTDFWWSWRRLSQSYWMTMSELIDDDDGSRGRRKRVTPELMTVRWRRWRRRRWLIVSSFFFIYNWRISEKDKKVIRHFKWNIFVTLGIGV